MTTLLSPAPKSERRVRQPKHKFQLLTTPYVLHPFMIAPVLPAESLTNLYMETRAVSYPVKNRYIGWKKEYYFYYVKISDLLIEAMRNMFIDPENNDIAATYGNAAQLTQFYSAKGAVPYCKLAYEAIVKHYFRDEGDAGVVGANGLAVAHYKDVGFLDSLTDKDDMPLGADIDDAATVADVERLLMLYEQLRAMNIANMTFEDWLRSQGIAIPGKDEDRPELLAYFSDFQYPSNTINPETGAASSALSWVFKNGNKSRSFMKEPGFVIGITVCRPKLYLGALAGSACEFMSRAWDWMPNYLRANPETSLKKFAAGTGPLGDRTVDTDDYWLDMNDILIHGDQFHNLRDFQAAPTSDGTINFAALPTQTLNIRYPSASDINGLFTGTVGVVEDGYASLAILGHQVDTTVGNLAAL
ncbi:major capsid protein [Microviridae sp.]|nr:major capsid protein [Microviridae sp.]